MEPFYNQYRDTLKELNDCARSFGVSLYGNLFYFKNKTAELASALLEKRMDFCDFAFECEAIVEIGFNAGHSALLGLTANDDLIYRSIDIGQPYSQACCDLLKTKFGDRLDLTIGSSFDVIPRIKEIYPEIEHKKVGWFIDGDHTYTSSKTDLDNILVLAKPGELIFIDDTNFGQIYRLVNQYLSNNMIRLVKRGERSMTVTRF